MDIMLVLHDCSANEELPLLLVVFVDLLQFEESLLFHHPFFADVLKGLTLAVQIFDVEFLSEKIRLL